MRATKGWAIVEKMDKMVLWENLETFIIFSLEENAEKALEASPNKDKHKVVRVEILVNPDEEADFRTPKE